MNTYISMYIGCIHVSGSISAFVIYTYIYVCVWLWNVVPATKLPNQTKSPSPQRLFQNSPSELSPFSPNSSPYRSSCLTCVFAILVWESAPRRTRHVVGWSPNGYGVNYKMNEYEKHMKINVCMYTKPNEQISNLRTGFQTCATPHL